MARTVRSDLIVPEILADAIRGEFTGVIALAGTGAALVSSTLPNSARGGDTLKVPYFGTLGELDDVAEDNALVPTPLTMDDDQEVVQHSGKAFEITEWAQMAAAFADPYAEAARQLRVAVQRRADQALIDAAATSDLLEDISGDLTPTINYDAVVDAKMQWADEQDDIVLMVVHSKQFGDLLKLKDDQNRPLLVDPQTGALPRFLGMPVKVSDRVPVLAGPTRYEALLGKRSALAFWFQGEPDVQTDKDILVDSRLAAVHVYWIAHLYRRPNGGTKKGIVRLRTT